MVFDGTTAGSLHLTEDPETGKYVCSEDIVTFDLMLDIGFLDQDVESRYRLELPDRFLSRIYCNAVENEDFSEYGKEILRDLSVLKERLKAKEPVRVWYSDYPESLCGFFWACTLFRDYDSEIYAMYAPKSDVHKNNRHLAKGWGSFNQFSLGDYFDLQRLLSREEIETCAEHWDMLVEQNAPLRAVINGIPVSVDKDFYDRFIIPKIPDGPIKDSELVWRVIKGNEFLPPSWIYSRVYDMIDEGVFKVVGTAPTAYPEYQIHMIIQKQTS